MIIVENIGLKANALQNQLLYIRGDSIYQSRDSVSPLFSSLHSEASSSRLKDIS